jgi:membrane protein implicated in regulation of membrane protease activity
MVYLWFILFLVSLILNGILAWYVRKLINQFKDAISSVSELQSLMDEYLGHIRMISEMETYYGDVTIENLLKHTKDMVDNLKLAGDRFSLLETQEGEENETKE